MTERVVYLSTIAILLLFMSYHFGRFADHYEMLEKDLDNVFKTCK